MEEMCKFVQTHAKDGTLVDTGGLLPSKDGFRVRLADGTLTVTDGPFTESKEVIGGFWVIDVPTREAAIELASHCPHARLFRRRIWHIGRPDSGWRVRQERKRQPPESQTLANRGSEPTTEVAEIARLAFVDVLADAARKHHPANALDSP